MYYLKKMFSMVKPYALSFYLGTFLYSTQNFTFPLIIGLLSRATLTGILEGEFIYVARGVFITILVLFGATVFVSLGLMLCLEAKAKAVMDLTRKLFRKFVEIDYEKASSGKSGEKLAAVNTDAKVATDMYHDKLTPLLTSALAVLFSTISLFIINFQLGLVAVGLGILAFFVQSRFTKPLLEIGTQGLEVNSKMLSRLWALFQGGVVLRTYDMQGSRLKAFGKDNENFKRLDFKRATISALQNMFTTAQGWLALLLTFTIGAILVSQGELDLPTLLMAPPLFQAIADNMSSIGREWADMQPSFAAAERIFSIIDADIRHSDVRKHKNFDGHALKIENLSFVYENDVEATLSNINLDISEGDLVVIVGESGSGKSTLLRALIGMYEKKTLGMTLGGIPFKKADLNAWRGMFAYVEQGYGLFNMSIRDNIAIGKLAGVDDAQIEQAARKAHAHEFIIRLKEGYNTFCGEGDTSISGGERQRVAIARALVKGAPILVFDEVASALDLESTKIIVDSIRSLRKKHTIIVTTHSPEIISDADVVVSMKAGTATQVHQLRH